MWNAVLLHQLTQTLAQFQRVPLPLYGAAKAAVSSGFCLHTMPKKVGESSLFCSQVWLQTETFSPLSLWLMPKLPTQTFVLFVAKWNDIMPWCYLKSKKYLLLVKGKYRSKSVSKTGVLPSSPPRNIHENISSSDLCYTLVMSPCHKAVFLWNGEKHVGFIQMTYVRVGLGTFV